MTLRASHIKIEAERCHISANGRDARLDLHNQFHDVGNPLGSVLWELYTWGWLHSGHLPYVGTSTALVCVYTKVYTMKRGASSDLVLSFGLASIREETMEVDQVLGARMS